MQIAQRERFSSNIWTFIERGKANQTVAQYVNRAAVIVLSKFELLMTGQFQL